MSNSDVELSLEVLEEELAKFSAVLRAEGPSGEAGEKVG